jgi:protein phosphatase
VTLTIEIPEPCLIVLVGAAGAGKSTLAARHFAPDEVLASDGFRSRLGRDEADQTANRRVFRVLHAALERRLAAGRMTVVDATNVGSAARRALIARADAAGTPAIAIVLDLPLAQCLAGDRTRADRHVPPAVVERQWTQLRAALDGGSGPRRSGAFLGPSRTLLLTHEGFAAVHLLTSREAVDAVTVRRRPGRWPTLGGAAPAGPSS